MKIETKYDIGQTVWKPVKKFAYARGFVCPVCKGSGKSILSTRLPCDAALGHTYKCKDGYMAKYNFDYAPQSCMIQSIEIDVSSKDNISVYYETEDNIGSVIIEEDQMYPTEQEAQEECDRLNGKNDE